MKKFLVFLVALMASIAASAQDVIVKNDNSTILCRIVEVNNNEVVYLKWSDLNGPRYVMDRSLIANINYQDGRQDKLNQQTSNAYAPGNQQTGATMYNDQALLAMDKLRSTPSAFEKEIKKYKKIAFGAGIPCIIIGLGVLTGGLCFDDYGGNEKIRYTMIPCGTIIAAAGGTVLYVFLTKAHKISKQYQSFTTAPIYQHEFNLGNGKSLYAGVDVIRARQYKQTTLGLGLQYNF